MNRFHSEDYLSYLEQYVTKELANKMALMGIDRFNYPPSQQSAVDFLELRQRYKVG